MLAEMLWRSLMILTRATPLAEYHCWPSLARTRQYAIVFQPHALLKDEGSGTLDTAMQDFR